MVTSCIVIGDATLDVTVRPERAMRPGGDVPAEVLIGPGGQGANVAVRLARQGVRTSLAAAIADDRSGRLLAEALRAEGLRLVTLPAERSAAVVIVLDGSGERTMLSDRRTLRTEALASVLEEAAWIHASAYPLLDDDGGDELARLLGGRAVSARLSVAGGSMGSDLALALRFRSRLGIAAPDLLALSLDEAGALLGDAVTGPEDAATRLRELAAVVVVTAGELGSAAACGSRVLTQEAAVADGPMLDATGAGDAYLATLLVELRPEPWPPDAEALHDAMKRATLGGSQAARVMGAQGRIGLEDASRVV